jgi:PAS domain S-box-containing protein
VKSQVVRRNAATDGVVGDHSTSWRRATEFLGVAVGYFALAKLGLSLASINPSASPIWPPTGYALAAVILIGNRAGLAIFAAALLANAMTAGSIYTSLAIALGNTSEALVGGYLIRRWSDGPQTFDSPSGVARFALFCSAAATPISATVGVGSLSTAGYISATDLDSVWMTWWLGDLASALVIAPAIVLWATSHFRSLEGSDFLGTALVCGAGSVVGLIAFSPLVKVPIGGRDALGFLAVLPLMWAALRGSQRDTATVSIILSCFAVWGTLFGHGPFARENLNESFLLLVAFLISGAVPSLALSAGVSEHRRTEGALRESEARLRTLTDRLPNAAVYQMIDDAGRRCYSYASRGIERLRGITVEAVLADPLLLRSQVLPQYLSALDAADAESSTNLSPFEHEFEVRLPSGEVRWLHLSSAPRRLPNGRTAWDGVQLDITERKRAEEGQRLLARELDHRAKNLLAVVQSILQLSRAEDIGSFIAKVRGRVMALARAHSLLSDNRWEGADLCQLIEEELAPYRTDTGRIAIDGPSVILVPAASQSIALALHELATNASKHGSLTQPTGRLAISWVVNADGLRLTWDESGGPLVEGPPTEHGFGSTIITASIQQGLKGNIALGWPPEGLRAVIFIPQGQLTGRGTVVGAQAAHIPVDAPAGVLAGRRILVVEDEPLVAMMAGAALAETGCTVVGPALTLAEALRLVEGEQLDAAVLDRNLGGEYSDSVAQRLRDRCVPFAVVTGYADAGLPLEFADVPSLAKPFEPDQLVALVTRLVSPYPC